MPDNCQNGDHDFWEGPFYLDEDPAPHLPFGTKCVCGQMMMVPGEYAGHPEREIDMVPSDSPEALQYLLTVR